MAHQNNQRKLGVSSDAKARHSAKGFNHQTWLSNLIGKNVCIALPDGGAIRGTLKAADQFTLLVVCTGEDEQLLFKSAIEGVREDCA